MNLETKTYTVLYSKILPFLAALQIFTLAGYAQVEIEITVDPAAQRALVAGRFVEGFRPADKTHLTFKQEVSGFPGLASRIGTIALFDRAEKRVEVRKLMDGEYVAAGHYDSWKYSVNLAPPKDRSGYAHASWLRDSGGVLMYDDLLPQFVPESGRFHGNKVTLKLPQGWTGTSAHNDDLSRSVVYIGAVNRVVDSKSETGNLQLVLSGVWHFTDEEAAGMAREIFDEYSKILGTLPKNRFLIALLRFPTQEQAGHWEAETRGRSVTIFSSDMAFRTQSLQRLHEQLRHEIFHLWFPNGINLIGDYAWFYEGFAMYSSLKLGVKLNRIRFEDFLDTLGRAYTIDSNAKPRKALTDTAIDPTVRYARGMLVAFMTDIDLLRNSGGKKDVSKSLRTLFVDRPRLPHGEIASEALKTVVTNPILIRRYVNGHEIVDWTADLSAVGIESKQSGRTTTLAIAAKPGRRQKEILDRLGYNNWRKIGTKK